MKWINTLLFTIFFSMLNTTHAQYDPSFSNYTYQAKRKNDQISILDIKMAPKLDEDIAIYSAKLTPNISTEVPCNSSFALSLGDRPFMQLMKQMSGATGQLFCYEKVSSMKEPYTAKYCQNVQACATSILGDLGLGLGAGTYIQKVLAEDYIQSEIKDKINEMEKMESITKFMRQKFPESIASYCPSKFSDSLKDSVCSARINSIFKASQKNCLYMKYDCYSESKQGLVGFREFSENSAGTFSNTFNSYFSQRTDEYVDKTVSADTEVTNELLSSLIGEEEDGAKEEKFYKMLLSYEMSYKLDPILTFYQPELSDENKLKEAKNRFGKFISDALKNKKSIEDLSKDFDQFRINLGNSIVQDNCEHTPSYEAICINSENIHAGNKGNKVKTEIRQALMRRDSELVKDDDARLSAIAMLFPKDENNGLAGMNNTEMSMMLLENARCISFDFEYSGLRNKASITEFLKEHPTLPAFTTTDSNVLFRQLKGKESSLDNKNKLALARARTKEFQIELETPERNRSERPREKEYSRKRFSEISQSVARFFEHKDDAPTTVTKKVEGQVAKKEDVVADTNPTSKVRSYTQDFSRWNGNQPPTIVSPLPEQSKALASSNEKHEVQVSAITTASSVLPKNEPRKVITKNSDDINNVKRNSSRDKNKEDSNSSIDQLRSLKNELSRLRESMSQSGNEKVQAEKSNVNIEVRKNRPVTNMNVDEEERNATVSKNESSQPYSASSAPASQPTSSSASSSSRNSNSSPEKSSHVSATKLDSNRSIASFSSKTNENYALVLNTQENTAEQNESAIVDNIISNDGKSFEVMMDGVPVRIVPLIDKGKLVYERGKPKYQIFVKDEKGEQTSKSVGDLKMQQEKDIKQASDRAQYKKLKEVSGKALQFK